MYTVQIPLLTMVCQSIMSVEETEPVYKHVAAVEGSSLPTFKVNFQSFWKEWAVCTSVWKVQTSYKHKDRNDFLKSTIHLSLSKFLNMDDVHASTLLRELSYGIRASR